EQGLISKQPGTHAYKKSTVERPDIPNILDRQFTVEAPNTVWCGDITYIWAQGKWHYLAAVLDLFSRRVVGWAMSAKPDADLVVKALDRAYEMRGRPSGVLFHSDSKNVLASVSMWSDSHSDRPMMDDLVVECPEWPDPHSDRPLCLSPDLSTAWEHCTSR
ncbi:putative transposase, partial [Halopseudomonas aestusnigri]